MVRFFLLFFFIPFLSFSQKLDSTKIDSVAKIVKKAVLDSLKKNGIILEKKKKKLPSDFHFFRDVFGKVDSTKKKIMPKIAIYRSLILPGWGQYTNKQYLIIPIVYAAAAGGIYSIALNNGKYQHYLGYLQAATDDALANSSTTGILVDEKGPFTKDRIEPAVNAFRRYRDLSYIAFGLGWLLQAVQANVQAHLKTFDMSNDISLKFEPSVQPTMFGSATGISVKIYLKAP